MSAICRIRLRAEARKIVLFSWIVSDYDGLGYVTTDDPEKGIVSFFCPETRREEALSLLEALIREGFALEILGPPDEWNRRGGPSLF
jgi:hypothetical protein